MGCARHPPRTRGRGSPALVSLVWHREPPRVLCTLSTTTILDQSNPVSLSVSLPSVIPPHRLRNEDARTR